MMKGNNFKDKFYQYFSTSGFTNKLLYGLVFLAIIFSSLTIDSFLSYKANSARTTELVSLLLIDLILLLSLLIVALRRILFALFKDYSSSRLRARIILMFSLVSVTPTIIVSVFSVLFFNFALQGWFDDKVSTAIDRSVKVAALYIKEHKLQLKESATEVAEDLNNLHYQLIHDPSLYNKILNTQAEIRSFNEAIIFERSTNNILGQTALSFSLAFSAIPVHLFEQADKGEVVEVKTDPLKIRMLIKLYDYKDTYLLIGRLIDKEIIKYIDKTNGAAQQYITLKNEKDSLQIKFAIIFLLIAALLLGSTIAIGTIFANKIIRPIRKLVKATSLVQNGDLSVQVSLNGSSEDELSILTNAFNKMVKKIDLQQKDLALAQRAMAWSDVARRVAHEIKNPLTPILLSADRLEKKYADQTEDRENFKKYTATILRHTNDIKKIVTEFADFAKMPSPVFEQRELVSLIKELVESRALIKDTINYRFDSNLEQLKFPCDRTQINQIMVNLLKNSEEALENSGGNKNISISLSVKEEEVYLEILDNGKGFPIDLIDKATEPYLTTSSKGSGLGLAIVKKIVNDHCGEIEIANHLQGGAKVKIIFDLGKLTKKLKN